MPNKVHKIKQYIIPNKLIIFLKKHRCLTTFKEEVIDYINSTQTTFNTKKALTSANSYSITEAFCWCLTKKGYIFWDNINHLWLKHHTSTK